MHCMIFISIATIVAVQAGFSTQLWAIQLAPVTIHLLGATRPVAWLQPEDSVIGGIGSLVFTMLNPCPLPNKA